MIHPWKYTIIRLGDTVVPLIHSAHLPHDRMAHAACRIMRDGEPFSAGFVQGLSIERVFGYSETLGMGSDSPMNDTALINIYDRTPTLWPKEKY